MLTSEETSVLEFKGSFRALLKPLREGESAASPWMTSPPTRKEPVMSPAIVFALSLALLAFARRELAAAGRALGMPDGLVRLIESLAAPHRTAT